MKYSILISILLGSFIYSSCGTTYRVISDHDKKVDFSDFQTYLILNHKDGFPLTASPINKQRIENAIGNEMTGLGYLKNQHPDLIVSWFVVIEDVKMTEVYYHHYNEWDISRVENESIYKKGTLVIDLIDTKKRKVVWHGKTSDHVYQGIPNIEEKINAAVNAIFLQYQKDVLTKKNYAAN